MTKTIIMSTRRRNLSEGDATNTEENPPLINSPSLESTSIQATQPVSYVDCFVTLPNDHVLKVEVDSKASGQDVLVKVCFNLGIQVESEYLGIVYRGRSNEFLWLNLRNRLCRQVKQNTPYRLDLRVKYFGQPHMIIGDECRHLLYIQARNQLVDGCWVHGVPESELCHVIALVTQAEYGSYRPDSSHIKYALFWPKLLQEELSSAAIGRIAHYHEMATDHESDQAVCTGSNNGSNIKMEYEVLRIMADNWTMYGVTFYDVADCFGKALKLGVGPEGIFLCSCKFSIIEKYTFEALAEVNYTDRVLELRLLQDDGSIKSEKYCMRTAKLAKCFQRYVTENNQFFKYDTVATDIIEHSRAGSFFKRSGSTKSYLYDVTKTSREVYDSARRRVHSVSSLNVPTGLSDNAHRHESGQARTESNQTSEEEVDEMRRELENLRELVQCVVCRDRKINRVFIPCMHIVCCELCAVRLSQCPVCRKNIKMSHPAYPKWVDEAISAPRQSLCPLPEDQVLADSTVFEDSPPSTSSATNHIQAGCARSEGLAYY